MGVSLKEEFYKFYHQKVAMYGVITMLVLMVYSALTTNITKNTLAFGFGSVEWIPIILIAVGSAFFAMEYSNNTIIMLIYKNSSKLKIYLAKLIVVFVYGFILTIGAILFTFILNWLFVPGGFSWGAAFHAHTLRDALILNMFGEVIYSVFIIGLSFMLTMLVKINAVVICIGLALAFFGASLSAGLMSSLPSLVKIIKWNPLNMIFISQQLTRSSIILKSNLTNMQLIVTTLIYGILFAIIGYYLFKNRRV
ncbi:MULTISPECIES: ABC transporter permease [unclassified Lactobacillus]|uniref:ABC transporter permease n=1 Tax=unclassified Lactobacillus TaxID=2620435 RepID=UPI000EFAF35F|nr:MULTISPECIES: ABC transporter permease [unclassified Lactobacillus]RMC39100.1 ABC transporter permease [Lactobacillus sp. ESL0237]RMC43383.1 ABC transporter permease [Lactobacillus sp. ESL0234]RMC44295.1 ABC transporter permease [Lactobacillus sp. ESL0236]RMC49397.1 ABC transporter permease [Lactobacillus sp. ESL0225]